jgi:polysaccharide export outer membrane protein
MNRHFWGLAAVLALSAWGQQAQEAPGNLPAQKLGPDDLLGVSVYGAPELSRTIRVGADGQMSVPLVERKIAAAGLMPAELEIEIARALQAAEILVDPKVLVTVVEYRSRPISVAGAVRRPLTFQAFGNVTLLDALTRAEGLNPEAGPEILVSKGSLVQRIPVKGLLDAADPDLNLRLTGGEEIRVPEAGRIYIVGNVRKPGAFPVRDSVESSVLKILALSEGLLPFSSDHAYIYRREGALGGKSEISIELKKIIDRKAPDVTLLANDILYIPDNKGRRATIGLLEKLLIFGSAAGAAGIYAGTR